MHTVILYAARLIAIAGIVFLSLFALDTLGNEAPLMETAVNLLVHLLPSAILLGVLSVSLRFEQIGGALFIAAGILPVFLLNNLLWVNLFLGSPFLLAGVLLLIHARIMGE